MTYLLAAPVRNWRCPACGLGDRTQKHEPHTQMHPCPALGHLNIPLIEVHDMDDRPDGLQVLVSREDNGLVGAVRTEHGDGRVDCTVLAPTAQTSAAAYEGR